MTAAGLGEPELDALTEAMTADGAKSGEQSHKLDKGERREGAFRRRSGGDEDWSGNPDCVDKSTLRSLTA
jgi:hypothetical protein